ncbi:MAG: hypothetical protein ACTSPQ_16265 [Candidatus Helarchaeota archaeon]
MASEESSIVKILTGILEDSVDALKRIEKHINEQNRIIKELVMKVDALENKFKMNLDKITNTSLPAFEKAITNKMESLGSSTLEELNTLLSNLIDKIKKNLQIMTIQEVIENINELTTQIKGKKPTIISKEEKVETPKRKEYSRKPAVASESSKGQAPIPVSAEEPEPIEEKEEEDHLVRPSSFFGS